jgi:outer membrane protein assembly factor BamB
MKKVLFGLVLCAAPSFAADWPQFRGATHDGSTGEKITKSWPVEGPKVAWKVPMGEGFSAVSVVGGRAYLNASKGEQEAAIALDAKTGQELWATTLDKKIYDRQGGNGPRSTPAIDGDRVYVFGTYLKLTCLNAADGKIVWQKDLKEFGGREIQWGHAASPVIEGDLVFVCGGGQGQSLLAFDKKTGDVKWKAESDGPTHATPTPATIFGTRQIIFRTDRGLVSVVPTTGAVLWRYEFPHRVSSAASPIVGGDIVYVSSAYGVGAGAAKIAKDGDKWTATEIWRKQNDLMNHWTTPVYKDGHLYGLYRGGAEALRCVELATGNVKWTKGGFGWEGATTMVDGDVLIQNNRGDLVLIKATPEGYQELSRAQPIGGQCWTMATVSNGHIFARSMTEVACLDVKPKTVARAGN